MALINKLTAIADAIREKTGSNSQLSLDDMATEIGNISGGGSSNIEPITVSENILGSSGGVLERDLIDGRIILTNITSMEIFMKNINKNLFTQAEYESLPELIFQKLGEHKRNFVYASGNELKYNIDSIIFSTYSNSYNINKVWTTGPYVIENFDFSTIYNMNTFDSNITRVGCSGGGTGAVIFPKITAYNENGFRSYLSYVRPLIKNINDKDNVLKNLISALRSQVTQQSGGSGGWGIMNCFGQWYLNSIPDWYVEHLKLISDMNKTNYSTYLDYSYYECYKLKTVYFPSVPLSSMANAVKNTPRLRHILFIQGNRIGDGNYISNGSVLYLRGGYNQSNATNNQVACPDNKKIYDATTYEALKNDSDAWAYGLEWSFYGHSAAAETLTTLPNQSPCSDGYNRPCTIKFDGNSGLNTDDGPISDLTAEEIAVATNKGWTVTLV